MATYRAAEVAANMWGTWRSDKTCMVVLALEGTCGSHSLNPVSAFERKAGESQRPLQTGSPMWPLQQSISFRNVKAFAQPPSSPTCRNVYLGFQSMKIVWIWSQWKGNTVMTACTGFWKVRMVVEVLWPLFLFVILVSVRSTNKPIHKGECEYTSIFFLSSDLNVFHDTGLILLKLSLTRL